MRTKFTIIIMLIISINVQAQVKPINKQKVVKPIAQIKGTFKDTRDGKTYKTIKIGTQTWMSENLAFKDSSGCWVYDGDTANVAKYGYFYDWETANKVCPTAWHLPSDTEWTKLTTYLGGEEKAGVKMKSTSGWNEFKGKTGNGTNSSGFTGLPGGYRYVNGSFYYGGSYGGWWSSSESSTKGACFRYLNYDVARVFNVKGEKSYGMSVRCLRDL